MQAIQSGILSAPHSDLITSLSISHHGTLLATSSLDHTLHISHLPASTPSTWTPLSSFTAHSSPVLCTAFAHPEFGTLLASGGSDGLIHLWSPSASPSTTTPASNNATGSGGKWTKKAALTDARGSIRAVEFAPPEEGLKIAAISTDGRLRVWECLDLGDKEDWGLVVDLDVDAGAGGGASGQGAAGGSASLSEVLIPGGAATQAGSMSGGGSSFGSGPSGGTGSSASAERRERALGGQGGAIETDGGWALSWLPESWWGARIAVSSGSASTIKLFHLPSHASPVPCLTLSPPRAVPSQTPIISLSFAPPSGRSYQLLAAASKDQRVRIWKIFPPEEGAGDEWKAEVEAELEDAGERVSWNLVGTVLCTGGGGTDGGRVKLWKATYTGQWRVVAAVRTEEEE